MPAPKHNKSKPDSPAYEKTRAKIQTTQLVKRLNQYALNEKDEAGQEVELDSNRIRAIQILLDKSLPSLTATTIDADVRNKDGLEAYTEEELDAAIKDKEKDLE